MALKPSGSSEDCSGHSGGKPRKIVTDKLREIAYSFYWS
jgi:hypothetical protein